MTVTMIEKTCRLLPDTASGACTVEHEGIHGDGLCGGERGVPGLLELERRAARGAGCGLVRPKQRCGGRRQGAAAEIADAEVEGHG